MFEHLWRTPLHVRRTLGSIQILPAWFDPSVTWCELTADQVITMDIVIDALLDTDEITKSRENNVINNEERFSQIQDKLRLSSERSVTTGPWRSQTRSYSFSVVSK